MRINWKVRMQSVPFWLGIVGAVGAPVLAYTGMEASDITTWQKLADLGMAVITNPFLLATVLMSVAGVVVDPTTEGFGDSDRAMGYDQPAKHLAGAA
jgi:phi LC3 family holin